MRFRTPCEYGTYENPHDHDSWPCAGHRDWADSDVLTALLKTYIGDIWTINDFEEWNDIVRIVKAHQ